MLIAAGIFSLCQSDHLLPNSPVEYMRGGATAIAMDNGSSTVPSVRRKHPPNLPD